MKKGFYFSQVETTGLGPRRKILGQIKAFEESGISLELVENPFCLSGRIRGNFLLRQLICRLPFTYVYSRHQYEACYTGADVFYVRFLAGDRYFVQFLKQLRQNNPQAKILLELPDYPTTWYMTTSLLYTFLYFPIIIKDWNAGRKYKKYVDRIVIPQEIENAFHIPVLSIENGINVSDVRCREPEETEVIRIIAVAGMCNFHGYDRLIEGLKEYYAHNGERKIELHMVGGKEEPGNELSRYRDLCTKYHLEKNIFFYGEKKGEELDKIYDKCNLAAGSLGMYRIGYKMASSLKIREYLAKGMPVITGSKVDVFEKKDFPYYLEFENNGTPIKMQKVIEFYDSIYGEKNMHTVNKEIRDYAAHNCDMKNALQNVIDYIQG
ncbi:MAG: glycosyltransferase family 4 protein [Lachnospiraceae bacterium]|nr:glycosyltransferase family 4 protein [Lachnospiraceae bacterium]